MRKMWIIALICLCQALAAESSSSVIKCNITNPNVTEDETTAPTLLAGGGKDAKDGQFPWAVALYFNGGYFCSAAILSERIVLTAAHCVFNRDPNDFIGHAGSANKSSPAIRIEFENFRIHPNYNDSVFFENDIAVLKTKERINFTKNVNKICIASEKTKDRGYQNLTAMGWGRLGESREHSIILQYLEMEFLDNRNSSLKDSGIHARTINGEICQGDSGGPLVEYFRKKKAILVGVLSGSSPAPKEWMGVTSDVCSNTVVFVKVSLYNDFIMEASGKDDGICIMSD